jgi:hypothetical protein
MPVIADIKEQEQHRESRLQPHRPTVLCRKPANRNSEAITAGTIQFAHVPSSKNIAQCHDQATPVPKPLTNMAFLGLIYYPLLFRTPESRENRLEQTNQVAKELQVATDSGNADKTTDTMAEF